MKRVFSLCVSVLAISLGGMANGWAATTPIDSGAHGDSGSRLGDRLISREAPRDGSIPLESADRGDTWIDLDPGQAPIPLGLLFDSGTPVTDPNFTCGGCFAWSSTYVKSGTDYDFTGRRFAVPSGSFASAFRLWWAYGEEGPHPNSANLGGGPGDFSSITLDLYDTSGPGGAPGALLANLTGTWTVLDAPTHYKEFLLDVPYEFVGTDYYVSLRGETALSGYQATLLWLTCADPDSFIDYEDFFNPLNGTTSGWAPYPTLPPCYEDLDFGLQIIGGGTPDLVSLDPDPGCINATHPCRSIDFDFERADVSPVRGVSVTFRLTDLYLCGGEAGIHEGSYLSGHCGGGCTAFQVIDNMDDTYTVDCAILGAGCGPDSSGTLFSIDVGSNLTSGTGFVDVLQVLVRDCVNMPVPGLAGDTASIDIDTVAPSPVGDLATVQKKTGNGANGRTAIEVTFTGTGTSAIEVYRAPYGDGTGASAYPEYDDLGGTPPTTPSYPPGPPWSLTSVSASGDLDEPAERGYWYYAVFVKDDCGNVSPVSNITGGNLDYHLGDVSDGANPGEGDNDVGIPDISLIGANYGIALAPNDPVNYLDVGPTDDNSVDGLPLTDNLVNFDDIILFAINYAQVSITDPGPIGSAVAGRSANHPPDPAADRPATRPATRHIDPATGRSEIPQIDRRTDRSEESRLGQGDDAVPVASSPGDPLPRVVLVPAPGAQPGQMNYFLQLIQDTAEVQGLHAVIDLGAAASPSSGSLARGYEIEPAGFGTSSDAFFASYEHEGVLVVDLVQLGNGRTLPGSGMFARLSLPSDGTLSTGNSGQMPGQAPSQMPARISAQTSRPTAPSIVAFSLRGTRNQELVPGPGLRPGESSASSLIGGVDGRDASSSSPQESVGLESLRGTAGIELLGARPNPFVGSTEIRFRTAVSGPVRLRVVDVRGRRVNDVVYDFASPGEHGIVWDGSTSEGASAASGLYLFELRSGSSTAHGRIFLSR